MTEQEFQINLRAADTFRRLSNPPEGYFWEGYRRGFSRHYHGEIFGTADEHAQWMMMSAHGIRDRQRYYRGLGYQCGFAGTNASDAMVQFQPTAQAIADRRSASSEAQAIYQFKSGTLNSQD